MRGKNIATTLTRPHLWLRISIFYKALLPVFLENERIIHFPKH